MLMYQQSMYLHLYIQFGLELNTITGKVSEASFEDGTGRVKVGDKYYSIGTIISVKDDSVSTATTAGTI